jgi:Ion channel
MVPSPASVDILLPLAVSLAVTFGTIVIHALVLIAIIHYVRRERRLGHAGVRFWQDVNIVGMVAVLAFIAHLIEIAAWAVVFILCAEFTSFAPAFYHSAVNYTSLGYGDVIMTASWKLLGPLETADGMLMFGISTAMLFAVIQRLVETRFHNKGVIPSEG